MSSLWPQGNDRTLIVSIANYLRGITTEQAYFLDENTKELLTNACRCLNSIQNMENYNSSLSLPDLYGRYLQNSQQPNSYLSSRKENPFSVAPNDMNNNQGSNINYNDNNSYNYNNNNPDNYNQNPNNYNQNPNNYNQNPSNYNQNPSNYNQNPSNYNQNPNNHNQNPNQNQVLQGLLSEIGGMAGLSKLMQHPMVQKIAGQVLDNPQVTNSLNNIFGSHSDNNEHVNVNENENENEDHETQRTMKNFLSSPEIAKRILSNFVDDDEMKDLLLIPQYASILQKLMNGDYSALASIAQKPELRRVIMGLIKKHE